MTRLSVATVLAIVTTQADIILILIAAAICELKAKIIYGFSIAIILIIDARLIFDCEPDSNSFSISLSLRSRYPYRLPRGLDCKGSHTRPGIGRALASADFSAQKAFYQCRYQKQLIF